MDTPLHLTTKKAEDSRLQRDFTGNESREREEKCLLGKMKILESETEENGANIASSNLIQNRNNTNP